MPFCRSLDIGYPSGLRHVIFNLATPVGDVHIQLVQVLIRNDRDIPESTDPDVVSSARSRCTCRRTGLL
jgi:hypothetical protein